MLCLATCSKGDDDDSVSPPKPDNVELMIPRQDEMDYVLENYDGVSYNVDSGRRIVLSNQYLAQYYRIHGAEAVIKENIGILAHEVTHSYQLRPQGCGGYQQGTVYHAFIEGMADAVRVLCGRFSNEEDRPKGGHYLNSYRYTGFFLAGWSRIKTRTFCANSICLLITSIRGHSMPALNMPWEKTITWMIYGKNIKKQWMI